MKNFTDVWDNWFDKDPDNEYIEWKNNNKKSFYEKYSISELENYCDQNDSFKQWKKDVWYNIIRNDLYKYKKNYEETWVYNEKKFEKLNLRLEEIYNSLNIVTYKFNEVIKKMLFDLVKLQDENTDKVAQEKEKIHNKMVNQLKKTQVLKRPEKI